MSIRAVTLPASGGFPKDDEERLLLEAPVVVAGTGVVVGGAVVVVEVTPLTHGLKWVSPCTQILPSLLCGK